MLDLIAQLRGEFDTSILFISHNLAVVARMCDRVGVLYAGTLVEEGPTRSSFDDAAPSLYGRPAALPAAARPAQGAWPARHHSGLPAVARRAASPGCVFAEPLRARHRALPTRGAAAASISAARLQPLPLSRARRRSAAGRRRADLAEPLRSLAVRTPDPRDRQSDQDLPGRRPAAARRCAMCRSSSWPGETLGLVGESGSGKTTFARLLLGLTAARSGERASSLTARPCRRGSAAARQDEVKALQIVFQNPNSALNRSHSVRRLIGRPLTKLAGLPRQRDAAAPHRSDALPCGWPTAIWRRSRGSSSGGLKQRVAIARAFAGDPRVVVCDEPTSALDVSVQAAILNLLADLQAVAEVSYVFISHDLGVVRYLSDRIAVLYLGRLDGDRAGRAGVLPGRIIPIPRRCCRRCPTSTAAPAPRIRLSGRDPERHQSAARLRLPHPLPAQARAHLRKRGAAACTWPSRDM